VQLIERSWRPAEDEEGEGRGGKRKDGKNSTVDFREVFVASIQGRKVVKRQQRLILRGG